MTIRQTALIGFSPFETMTLESFFRLAGRRPPGYSIGADPERAHVLVVNADNAAQVQALWAKSPQAKVILIGASAHGTNWVLMSRPIRLLVVLDMIEKILAGTDIKPILPSTQATMPAATAPAAQHGGSAVSARPAVPPMPPPAAGGFSGLATVPQRPASVPEPEKKRGFGNSRGGLLSFANSQDHEPVSTGSPVAAKDDDDLILVVDDSDIVLRFMQGRLQRFGYSVALASTGEQAVEMTQIRAYKFVFLDVMMPGIDGYQTCRMIKKQKHASGAAPVVVMLSSRGGSIDKIRGTLAGADAYLTKPLAEAALIKVLADHDTQTANNFSATRPASR